MFKAEVNGEIRSFDKAINISQFLKACEIDERIVVVEYNGQILPRIQYSEQVINSGDVLEIVQMMAGG